MKIVASDKSLDSAVVKAHEFKHATNRPQIVWRYPDSEKQFFVTPLRNWEDTSDPPPRKKILRIG